MPISRTNIRVRRVTRAGEVTEYPTILFAYRQLLGSSQELGYSEHQRIRAELRRGRTAQDSRGNIWSAVGEVQLFSSVEAAVAAQTGSAQWSDFTFGVEIECIQSALNHYDIQRKLAAIGHGNWRVVHDGSIGGAGHEVVSPVLKGQIGLDALKMVMDALVEMGCSVNAACGLHVHVGARDLEVQALRNLSFRFLSAEEHFDSIVQPSRRGDVNRYCYSNVTVSRQTSGARRSEEIRSARTVQQIARVMNGGWETYHYTPYRYRKLNFQSFALHGTVEFRQHGGTVESSKACAWVRLITGFVADAANRTPVETVETMSFEQFLEATDDAGKAFFTRRRDFFARRSLRQAA